MIRRPRSGDANALAESVAVVESDRAVTETQEAWLQRLGRWSGAARAGLLLAVFAFYGSATTACGWFLSGDIGLIAAIAATGICLIACLLALGVTQLLIPPQQAAAHVLSGMMIRMSLPLLASLLIIKQQPAWITAGFGWFIVGAFLLGLLVETLFSVGQLQLAESKPAPPSVPSAQHGTSH